MHVVAAKPLYLSEAAVPPDVMAREEEISRQQLDSSGQLHNKKPDVVAKIVRGKVLKRMSEVCLLSQPHVAEEGGPLVGKFLAAGGVACDGFTRWALGGH
jgi:elongation factor Ts